MTPTEVVGATAARAGKGPAQGPGSDLSFAVVQNFATTGGGGARTK